jgi:fructose-1,6-bisphosphatase I
MTNKKATLAEFLDAGVSADLAKVLLSISDGCKVISGLVNNAGVSDILGDFGSTNVHGEKVQKLDDLTNRILMDYLGSCAFCAGYFSEENEDIATLNIGGKYTAAVDPLDGSSNIDVAAPIGTIFCLNQRLSPIGPVTPADFLQKGNKARSAGYAIYGSSTVLVFTTGKGVNGFTLNTIDNEFYLSHPNMVMPAKGKIYSVNQGNASKFDDGVIEFIEFCTAIVKEDSRPFSLRYIGSMIGDIHRNLLKGGIFMYPANKGETTGKLRLLYECIPMAFITQQAGGEATDGRNPILDLQPVDLHERTAIFIGSKNLVQKAMEYQAVKR